MEGLGTATSTETGNAIRVFIGTVMSNPVKCRYFVVTETSHKEPYTARLEQSGDESSWPYGVVPSIIALAEIDGRPGLEIGVAVESGASTISVGIYGHRDAGLIRFSGGGAMGPVRDAFSFGGSGGQSFAVDCSRKAPGELVQIGLAQEGDRVTVRKLIYELIDSGFVLKRRVQFVTSLSAARKVASSEEPFLRCPEHGQ